MKMKVYIIIVKVKKWMYKWREYILFDVCVHNVLLRLERRFHADFKSIFLTRMGKENKNEKS